MMKEMFNQKVRRQQHEAENLMDSVKEAAELREKQRLEAERLADEGPLVAPWMQKQPAQPTNPRPTTTKPMTLPALNATRRPSLRDPVPPVTLPWESFTSLPAQAAVVRVLPARVAVSTRSETAQNLSKNHPRPPLLETTRVDGVKAGRRDRTARASPCPLSPTKTKSNSGYRAWNSRKFCAFFWAKGSISPLSIISPPVLRSPVSSVGIVCNRLACNKWANLA